MFINYSFLHSIKKGILMAYYDKGANAERELLYLFAERGFSVVRSAGSGKIDLPTPDIVAMSPKNKYAIECKAQAGAYLNIKNEQMFELIKWAKNARINLCIAWKITSKGWRFLKLGQFKQNKKGFLISKDDALENGLSLEDFIRQN